LQNCAGGDDFRNISLRFQGKNLVGNLALVEKRKQAQGA
jgi:hypothetical protein